MPNKTLIEMLLEAGYPREDIHHHASDLYIFITPTSAKVLQEWARINWKDPEAVLRDRFLVDRFRDNITGRPMYDIAFQYYENY